MKKLVNAIALVADYALGAMLVMLGTAIVAGGVTGTLWL